jgi:PHD/YefM family antitoxin component YafN of YafNO toxin-antitoxin module
MELHPQLIQKAGRNEFVVLPIEEFEAMTELIETYEDLRELREAKEQSAGEKPVPLNQVIYDLGL